MEKVKLGLKAVINSRPNFVGITQQNYMMNKPEHF